ncbi:MULTISPECIES: hypothetical protein [Corynebacterium]|mgnify:FL=1|uniref:Uncharacterized protein n=2 Tax=Corynebacterium TaxID=1716 RepID=A0ACC4UA18_9CORY|nr:MULTISPECIES: hypothetical protein [Corynebacterium]KKO78802.1 hypothetical protein WU87_08510 [Corynebacterium minutissimum]MTD91453.1 hypothetical protein [Corynebacterium aurimucosum]OFK65110.1 hypothetical protein HMPREF2807_12140 [Corynebacterium sp. HMSC074A09]OFK68495.1 hypothetical protein HMPREF2806_06890 [Corynebacterium sp. HMSC076G08]OFN77512.1 hypothetical protein HMPREF2526_02550 [Corynebacterium sp. HMSC070E08]
MRRTIIAVSTAIALTVGGTAAATAAESSADKQISTKVEGSSYYQELRKSTASSNDPQLNNFYAVLLDGLVGLTVFAILGSIYGEVSKRLPM